MRLVPDLMTGEQIRQWRETHGLTQRTMAEMLGLGRSDTISRWELETRDPQPYLYLALEALDARLNAHDGN